MGQVKAHTRKGKQVKAHSRKDLVANKPMKSWKKDKKMVVLATKNGVQKVIHFGQKGYRDFTQHKDPARKANYLSRSAGIMDKNGNKTANDKHSANYWSRKVLW